MIILSALLIALLLLASAIVVRGIFKPKWTWLNKAILVAAALALILGTVSIVAGAVCDNDINDLKAESEHINLYYNTVLYTDNEYVRFDFYQRVQDYNDSYAELQEKSKSIWIGAFYPKGWDTEILPIEFLLNVGAYG
jgi:glucan phosphoethanolaminetransferase (alkaline phosphatase superfamily)